MTILTAAELREHIETDLGDDAVNRLAGGAEAIIVGAVGAVASHVDYLDGGDRELFTTRAVATITTIKERDYPDDAQVALSANDYLSRGKFRIIRLREGDNPRLWWAPMVEVTYVPDINADLLATVQINLVKLAVGYSGFKRETDGDFDFWHEDTAKETRAALLPLTRAGMTLGIR